MNTCLIQTAHSLLGEAAIRRTDRATKPTRQRIATVATVAKIEKEMKQARDKGKKNMTKLKSIKSELAACRAAFKANPDAKFAWCCHHEILVEPLTETPETRIEYILENKHEGERALRFRNFRPVRVKLPEAFDQVIWAYNQAMQAHNQAGQACTQAMQAHTQAMQVYNQAMQVYTQASQAYDQARQARQACKPELELLHTQDWPDHSWNGRSIFV